MRVDTRAEGLPIRQLRERFNPFEGMKKLNKPITEDGIGASNPFRIPDFGSAVLQLSRMEGGSEETTENGLSVVRFTATDTIVKPLMEGLGHLEVVVFGTEEYFNDSSGMRAVMEHRGRRVAQTDPEWFYKWEELVDIAPVSPDITMVFEQPEVLRPFREQSDGVKEDRRFVLGTHLSQLRIPMFYFDASVYPDPS